MGVLAKEIRFGRSILVPLNHTIHRRVHLGVHIGHLVLAFIMDGTAVQGFHSIPFGHNVAALARLVAQAPEQHRGVQAVPADHPYGAVHIGRAPRGRVAKGLVAVAFLVGLVHDVQAVPVVEGIHLGVVGIVAGAHRIHIVALHEHDVLYHALHRHGLAMDRVDVVAVCAL